MDHTTTPRKTLRQSLKDLLRLLGRSTPKTSVAVGSGILRKADPSFNLPQFSTVSLFPDFGASDFDIDRYPIPDRLEQIPSVPTLPSKPHSKHSLLPATTLSHFDLRSTFVQHGEIKQVPRRTVHETLSDAYLSGLSRQASLASIAPSALHRSVSSLRIRESLTDLGSAAKSSQACGLGKSGERCSDGSPHQQPSQIATPSSRASSAFTSTRQGKRSSLTLVEHFQSFCVLDTAMPGYPVTATSAELRYIFEVGESFFLNNQEAKGTSMDIVTGLDAAGNPITHLVLFSPLIAPSSGRSRFMFASLVDVTGFIHETATLPELGTISEEPSIASLAEAIATPPMSGSPGWNLSHELSVEDLLGGCCLSDDDQPVKPRQSIRDDIWLDLAVSEGGCRPSARNRNRTRPPSTPTSTTSRSSTSSSVDDMLDQFVTSLQELYSDFFLLGKSPLDDHVYEICNVSPKVYASREYIDGHLSRTPREAIDKLSASLAQSSPFTIPVKWGGQGEPKQLYCAPLYGQRSLTWICFLVDAQMPMFW